VAATFYGPGRDFDERESAWRKSDEWMSFLKARMPHAITFVYMPDEPNREQFDRIRRIAENIKSNPGPGGKLPVFVTRHYTEDLDGAIDIWDSGPRRYDIKRAESERARGRDHWIYNGGGPAGGASLVYAPATHAPPPASCPGPVSNTASKFISTGTASTGDTTLKNRATASRTSGSIRSPSTTAASRTNPPTIRISPTATAC